MDSIPVVFPHSGRRPTDGLAILEEIRDVPGLRRLAVVVLTGSQNEDDLRDVYESNANACLVKLVEPTAFADQFELCVEFWASAVTLPPDASPDVEI